MTDIDFDELDKAVNSLMQQHKDETETESPTSSTVASADEAPVQVSSPEAKPAEPVSSNVSTDSSSTTPSLATKRTNGRFMDVVHPSSDMTSAHVTRPHASRVGMHLLQPSPETISEVDNLNQANQNTSDSVDVEQTSSQDHLSVLDSDIPEKALEPAQTESESASAPEADLDEAMSKLMAQELNETAQDSQSPLETPFVQGAVVDKRPLGGVPIDTPDIATTDESSISKAPNEIDTQVEPVPIPAQPLAPELDKDLMALESSDLEASPELDKVSAKSIEVAEPVLEQNEEPQPEEFQPEEVQPEESQPPKHEVNNSTPQATSISGDIPQQYATQPDNDPQPVPMYDAATESPELAHKEKKKSGWLTVLLILLLLIVGAAGGAAIWYFLL